MKIFFILLLCLMLPLQAYHASVILDDDPLMLPSLYHLVSLEDETFLVHMIIDENQASSYRVYPFLSTVLKSGFYRLATSVSGTITIATTDVMLDLAGNTITGGVVINSGLKNITIKRGTIIATGTDGILVNAGCSTLSFYDMVVQNATRGINLNQATDSVLERCTMTSNVTGLLINTSSNVVVKSCNAVRNSNTGFSLTLSTTCSLTDCKALSTGDGNTAATSNNIYGFISQNGFGNVFSGCIANATQALSTTDYNSIVAGFALTGTEQFSQIRDSIASNAATSSSGITLPYGIYLQGTVSGFISVTSVNTGVQARGVAWTSDGQYVATGNNNGIVTVYRFDRTVPNLVVIPGSSAVTGTIRQMSWSPDSYLAVAANTVPGNLKIFWFDRVSQKLLQIKSLSFSGVGVRWAAWSPNGQYLAVALDFLNSSTPDVIVYQFDRVGNQLIQTNATATLAAGARAVSWSPDSQYLLVGTNTGAVQGLFMYQFIATPLSASLGFITNVVPESSSVVAAAWSPNGLYVAGGFGAAVWVYQFNKTSGTLTVQAQLSASPTTFAWSPDSNFIAVGSSNNFIFYNIITKASLFTVSGNFDGLSWSPDGQYLGAATAAGSGVNAGVVIYSAFSFPSNNVIKNNIATCNTGGQYPSGVGISGSSIANLIIQNTAYDNPRNPSIAFTNYNFVCDVFSQLFGLGPTYLQNKEVNNLILQPADVDTTVKIVESKLSLIQAQVNSLLVFA